MIPLWITILLIVLLSVISFLLGYDVAETRERHALSAVRRELRFIERQKNELSSWVRTNWPNEYAARREGHLLGYQQGILHAAELERDDADAS